MQTALLIAGILALIIGALGVLYNAGYIKWPAKPPVEPPKPPPPEIDFKMMFGWLDPYTWLSEWTAKWKTPAKSNDKAIYRVIGSPDGYRLRAADRNADMSLKRNGQEGLILATNVKSWSKLSPPLVHNGDILFGFAEQTIAGTETDGGPGVVLIGDRATRGHEYYVMHPARLQKVGTWDGVSYEGEHYWLNGE